MAAQQKVTIEIPAKYASDARSIADDMLTMIQDRSELGVGVKKRGKGFSTYDFPDYTPQYEKVKGQKRVDLRLSDEMLYEGMQVLSVKGNKITLGFKAGTKVNAKAEGNQIGSYGRDPNPKKARRFLGITADELDAILAGYGPTEG